MHSDVITLISETFSLDEHGNQIADESKNPVFADVTSISQSEFYEADHAGLKAEYRFKVYADEYKGEELVEYAGERYRVYRTYKPTEDTIELYVESRLGVSE